MATSIRSRRGQIKKLVPEKKRRRVMNPIQKLIKDLSREEEKGREADDSKIYPSVPVTKFFRQRNYAFAESFKHEFPKEKNPFMQKENVEMTPKRRKRPANQYQETNLMKHAKDAYDWSEEELNSLWVGVRRYGQSNWEAMLNDSMLKFSIFKTPTSLSERWIVERQKFQLDFIQVPQLAVQTRSEAAIMNDFTMIQMKEATSSSRSKRKVAVIGHARYRKLVIKETTEDQDNITDMENNNDSGKSDSELSFKGWIKGDEVSSDGTSSA